MATNQDTDYAIVECRKISGKLRARIITPGYRKECNCQFPRSIREDGAQFKVPYAAITLKQFSNSGRYFYTISGSNFERILQHADAQPEKIYAAEECVVCMCAAVEKVIVPCGHACLCATCAKVPALKNCPICRGKMNIIIDFAQID